MKNKPNNQKSAGETVYPPYLIDSMSAFPSTPINDIDEIYITIPSPGLDYRTIGPGDDIVVSEEVLEQYLTKKIQEARISEAEEMKNELLGDKIGGDLPISDLRYFFEQRLTQPHSKEEVDHE